MVNKQFLGANKANYLTFALFAVWINMLRRCITMLQMVNAKNLKKFISLVLQRVGLSMKEAEITSDVLVSANLYGVDSHGISLIETYIRRINEGGIKINPKRNIEKINGFVEMIDASGGIGPVTASLATERVIKMAKEDGVGTVMVKNSNHIGMLGYYANMIAENEMIGIVLTNSGPNVAAWGGAEAVLGNNAIAVSVPGRHEISFLLDIASGEVACGKVRTALEKGDKKIPFGWIVDKDGRDTDSPLDFLSGGVVLPFGKHKGYGIGMLIDLFTGVLSGGLYASQVKKQRDDYSSVAESSHTFIGIRINLFMELEQFFCRIEDWVALIKSSKRAEGIEEILIPGERELRSYQKKIIEGINLDQKQIAILNNLGRQYNLDTCILQKKNRRE
ncbi:Ldh family oxidoreductase [Bacillus paralicheniformis]|uniref:Ldh family oxidoreductase n=1 Tax=Bacillus paralicheniformis TaxID=1648923 RepID=UPI0024C20144|nr:Ldh family oxidoreductase [Bacillus paralicheniformis]WHX86984.1 Ldh family oxidoreductase [Bacillus paralicheniformis]